MPLTGSSTKNNPDVKRLCLPLLIINFCSISIFASDSPPSEIEQTHNLIDSKISNLAQDIDSVLGGRKAWEEENTSYLELTQELYGGELNDFSQFTYRFRLQLPQTNKRMHLFLERQKETLMEPTSKEKNYGQNEPQRRHRIGHRFDHFKTKHFFASIKTGARINAFKLKDTDGFVEYRIRYHYKLSDDLNFESSITPSYYIIEHLEYESDTHMDYTPWTKWLFRITNGISWRETDKIFNLSQGLSASFQGSNKKTVSLAFAVNSNDLKGLHAQSYQVATNYGQPLFWDWITLALSVNLLFDKSMNYKGDLGYGGTLSIKFGF